MARKKKQTTDTGAAPVNPADQGAEPVKKEPAAAAAGQDHDQQEPQTIRIGGQEVTVTPATEEPGTDAEAAEAARKTEAALNEMLKNPAIEALEKQQRIIAAMQQPFDNVTRTQEQISAAMQNPAIEALQKTIYNLKVSIDPITEAIKESHRALYTYFQTPEWARIQESFRKFLENAPQMLSWAEEIEQLRPYFEEELKKPEYKGYTLDALLNEEATEADELFLKALQAARAARDARQAVIDAQNEGREQRRRAKEAAQKSGAIMDLRNGIMPIFSERGLWDAFSPSRISRMGKLSDDVMDKATGRINDDELESGDILPMNAAEISYKALMLLSAIKANSVENFRETFVKDGAITFYVKGVLDRIDINPRPHDDMQQITLDRKTAGALYLEKQFEPLLNLVGTTPNGSRYAVFNYYGYNVENDTMTIRTPYLFQLWMATQGAYSIRRANKERRIEEGKSPLKKDLKPLELNLLFTADAYKEDDAVLEIAAYITNVMLNAGRGAHKTKISYKTIIKNCSRLKERLDEIEALPTKQKLENGKVRNNAARYNVELRKIAKAFSLIMNPDKCNALKHFAFDEVTPTKGKGNQRELIPPTRRTLDGEIFIKWHLIDEETD